jgi:hypothetical protein
MNQNKTIIQVDSKYRYISEFLEDLPHNAYVDKQVTGCGGTTLVLTNKEPYVVAVHSKAMVYNKSAQHRNVLGITGETRDEEITDYLKCGWVKKIIVTYDSLPRLLKFINPSDYRLLVDEVQVLIRYAGEFKMKVCNDLLNSTYKFKTTSFLTATPTIRKYLPAPIKKLEYVEFKWESAKKPDIKHAYVGNQVHTKTIAFILDRYNNTDREIYVFYNSKSGVASCIKKLLKAEPSIRLEDVNVMFAENDENNDYFKKQLGKNFTFSYPINVTKNGDLEYNNKRINFISSFGFEGVDFYSENQITLIVSNSKCKSMRYDIAIDLPQIVGRFRRTQTNIFVNNEIYFIWNTQIEQAKMTEEEFIEDYKITRKEMESALTGENRNNSQIVKAFAIMSNVTKTPHLYVDGDDSSGLPNVQLNEYAFESLMSSFSAMHCDYYTLDFDGKVEDTVIYEKVSDIFATTTFTIPPLDLKYTKNLDRVFNFKKLAIEYVALVEKCESSISQAEYTECRERMQEILLCSDDLAKYVDALGHKRISAHSYNRVKLQTEFNQALLLNSKRKELLEFLNFSVEKIYANTYIKESMQTFYEMNGIEKNARVVDINEMFITTRSSLTGNIPATKILGVK